MAGCGRSGADDSLAAELASGKSVKDSATAAGIADRTAFRRLADPAFKARVAELRGEMVAQAAGMLADGMGEAAKVLRLLLTSADEHVQHKAAVQIISLATKVVELADLQKRIEELERRHEGGKL